MSQKNKLQLLKEKEQLEANKVKLEAIQAKQPEKWTKQLQAKLDETIGEIADIDEEIAALAEEAPAEKSEYTPGKGTEKLVHLSIVRGRRFNSMTGKEESMPYIQMFTYGEFQLFKKNASLLGYSVLKVLHDPYGEAKEMVVM